MKFTIGVVKASFGWMKAVGSKLITAVKAGWSQGLSSMTGVKGSTVALGAATNAAWSGIQTARHGGSWKDIFRSAVKGAVIGAIGAVTGAFMHGFGAGAGSLGGGGTSLTGTAMHAAAHGVSGGAMSAANGGSFKDGFIGGAIGFGVGLPFGGAGGMIQGSGPGAIAARTAIAAIGGGVGSKLAGGSFADGAYSAAFNHLFNNELENIQNGLRRSWEGAKAAFSHFGREFPNAAGALPGQLSQGMGQLMENDAIAATMVVSHAPMVVGGAIAAAPGVLASAPALLSGSAITTEALTGVSATGGVSAYAVYHGIDPLTGAIRYVGITGRSVLVRAAEHLNAVGTGKELLRYVQVSSHATKLGARIAEQTWINQLGGIGSGQLLNRINSIAKKYWNQHNISPN